MKLIKNIGLTLMLCLPLTSFAKNVSFCDQVMDLRTEVQVRSNNEVELLFMWAQDIVMDTTGTIVEKQKISLEQLNEEGAIDGYKLIIKTAEGDDLNLWILEFKDDIQTSYYQVYTNYFMPSRDGNIGTLMGSSAECRL